VEHLEAQRGFRDAAGAGIDQESVAGRERPVGVIFHIGVEMTDRVLAVVEVVAPMEETLDPVAVELDAQDTAAGRRHGHEAVADHLVLAAAVVGPKARHLRFQEWPDVVVGRDRFRDGAGLVEGEIAQGVDHGVVADQGDDQVAGRLVGGQVLERRFV